MKYRVRSNHGDLPDLVEQLVQREIDAYDQRCGNAVRSGEIRLYELPDASSEPMKCCLVEVALRGSGVICVTAIERRWVEAVREAFRKLWRDTPAVIEGAESLRRD